MADDEYNKKLESLQQYIPFLNNMIIQLKDPRKKNREQQLAKMVSLHSMITDKRKKLKLETLTKCEDVILKLYEKVKSGPNHMSLLKSTPPSIFQKSPITPSSPSPPRDLPKTKPVVIPTEKVGDRTDNLLTITPKIDIYSRAADSVRSSQNKQSVFDRLGKKEDMDMSKPPISLKDLEALQEDSPDVDTEQMSLNELTDLREKLQKQLSKSEEKLSKPKSVTINTTVRNNTILTKKSLERYHNDSNKKTELKPDLKSSSTVSRSASVKLVKETSNIFGSTLSSIDNKILEDVNKKDKDRRSSVGSRDYIDKPKSTADKIREISEKHKKYNDKSNEGKDKYKSSSSSTKYEDKSKTSPDRHKSEKSKSFSSDKNKFSFERKDKHNSREDKFDTSSQIEAKDRQIREAAPVLKNDKIATDILKSVETPPVYKRLADKYNPKPRKPSSDSVMSELNKQSLPHLGQSNVPLLSPSCSVNSMDGDLRNSAMHPLHVSLPGQVPTSPQVISSVNNFSLPNNILGIAGANSMSQIPPNQMSNILNHPNTTAIISTVVNQIKVNPTPVMMNPVQNFNAGIPGSPQIVYPPNCLPTEMNMYGNTKSLQNTNFVGQQGNFWPNQQQNYGPRNFAGTPVPNPFEKPQQVLIYPQTSQISGSFHRGNALPMTSSNDNFQDRDGRGVSSSQEWRRDPRLQRDPRQYGDERTQTRRESAPSWESRDSDHSNRSRFRDNRDTRDHRDPRDPRVSRNAPSNTRYDNFRTKSLSPLQAGDDESNKFASPLDSLYSGNDSYQRTGKGYGVQNFKMRKPKKDEDVSPTTEKNFSKDPMKQQQKQEEEEEDWGVELVDNLPNDAKKGSEENVSSSTENTSLIEGNLSDKLDLKKISKNIADAGEISSTNQDQENDSSNGTKTNQTNKTHIINDFLKKLLDNEQTRAAASVFIDNVSNSLDDEKLKMVVDTVKTAARADKKNRLNLLQRRKKIQMVKMKRKKLLLKRKLVMKKKLKSRIRVIRDDDEDDETEEVKKSGEHSKDEKASNSNSKNKIDDDDEDVVVSVGERTKSRKRLANIQNSRQRKQKRHRSEVDLLQEDLGDKFMNGIITGSEKRRCTGLKNKDEKSNSSEQSPLKARGRKSKSKLDSDKVEAMTKVRVVLPKLSLNEMSDDDDDKNRYLLRRSSKGGKSYAELDSDEDKSRNKKEEVEENSLDKIEKNAEKSQSIKEEMPDLDREDRGEELEDEKEVSDTKEDNGETDDLKMEDDTEPELLLDLVAMKKTSVIRRGVKPGVGGISAKKKHRKIVREDDEVDIPNPKPVEVDKNYYFSKSGVFKAPCRLCSFVGKNLILHYRMLHPDVEVLPSRLSPEKAEEAINESLQLKLDEEDFILPSPAMHSFVCRFCGNTIKSKVANFYDHVTTHTGEYRYNCTSCLYGVCTIKPLKLHYEKVHGIMGDIRYDAVRTKVYGYICTKCNFVQLKRENLEKHLNMFHSDEQVDVLKIHMSATDYMIKSAPKVKSVKSSVGDTLADANTTSDMNDDFEQDEEDDMPELKRQKIDIVENALHNVKLEITEEFPQDRIEPIIKKEIDMTVFTCGTDIQEENQKIEEERLKKMAELNETVKSNRQALSFVDQLSNRLLQEEAQAHSEIVKIKEEPIDPDTDALNISVLETEHNVTVRKIVNPEISIAPIACRSNSTDVAEKENYKIQGMIEKLQGILKEEKPDEIDTVVDIPEFGPPPLAPLDKSTFTRTVLNAGFLNIVKDSNDLEYACRVPSCLFTSQNREIFLNHWDEDHTRVNVMYKVTKCRLCSCEISATVEHTLLRNFFNHVEKRHLENSNISVIKMRRLSGDKLSLHTLALQQEDPSLKELIQEPTRMGSQKMDDNPFPFTIAGVMSLADDTIPPLSPIQDKTTELPKDKKGKVENIVLREEKITAADKMTGSKSDEAIKRFLHCTSDLYKCPQYLCKFSTNTKQFFEDHVKVHSAFHDELVLCVYCDIKTPLSQAALHIELRHSSCAFSCSQCLYRAVRKEYVLIHLKQKHDESDPIVRLPPRPTSVVMRKQKYAVEDACQPFICGHGGCGAKFLFQNEYENHSIQQHASVMKCGFTSNERLCGFTHLQLKNMMDHWTSHNCCNYHCLICKAGFKTKPFVIEHYSLIHPHLDLLVVDRTFVPLEQDKVFGYGPQASSVATYMKFDNMEDPSQGTLDGTSQSVKILHPTSAEKKFVSILPKTLEPTPVSPLFSSEEQGKRNSVFPMLNLKKKKEVVTVDEVAADPVATDPLRLDFDPNSNINVSGGEDSDTEEVVDVPEEKHYGLIGYQLFRCAFCDISFSNTKDFKAHSMHSKLCRDSTKMLQPFKCVHCTRSFKNAHGLVEHIQYHGQLRYGCSLCVRKFPSSFSLKIHMRAKHNITNTITTPVHPSRTNIDADEFIIRPVPLVDPPVEENTSSLSTDPIKDVYSPEEIELLPQRYIFTSELKCALCSYSTKVRTNLVRHLQFHISEKSVPDIAPVNPVPCLDKNEKMFDKMTNLANSSLEATSRMGVNVKQEVKATKEQAEVPAFVPAHRRYTCCASGCTYLCLEESNLRHHLSALHASEPSFICAHCKKVLKNDNDVFLKHLKLHDLHLYKCTHCDFLHYLRHKVDKHCVDKHPNKAHITITVRALDAEPSEGDQLESTNNPTPPIETVQPSNIKWTKPWHCGMCKYRCAAKNEIVSHIFNKHDINMQYKCTLCSYKTNEKHTFYEHFKQTHPESEVDFIHIYYKSEGPGSGSGQKQFDTTPLWQRDRPRVRHIRGILFEEISPSKTKKVTAIKSTPTSSTSTSASNLDLAIDAVAKGIDETTRKSPEFVDISVKSTNDKPIKDDSVIIIDHEDEREYSIDESDDLMVDTDSINSTTVKQEPKSIELYSNEILFNKYGKPCSPVGRLFKCPICLKFRTKKISCLLYHLLLEIKCYRFKCKCEYMCVSFDEMVTHCQEEHDSSLNSNVTDIPVPNTVLYWLQLIIRYQSSGIVQHYPVGNGELLHTPINKIHCEYCQRWFRNVHILKEHELSHWSEHTYICSHCCQEYPTLDDLFQHNFMIHSKYECDMNVKGPSVSKVIATLKRPPISTTVSPSTSNEETSGVSYPCASCSVVGKSQEELKNHYIKVHNLSLNHKIFNKSKWQVMYSCTYCHERATDKELENHHATAHKGLKYNIYQYICLECSGTFFNIKELRVHCTSAHSDKKMHYSVVENKQSAQIEQFICTKCPYRSCSVGGIRSHLKKHVRPVDCLTCGATFIYPTEARAHHNKEHINLPDGIEDNRGRLKEYEDLVKEIVKAREERMKKPPAPPPQRKMLARKSTGAPFIRDSPQVAPP